MRPTHKQFLIFLLLIMLMIAVSGCSRRSRMVEIEAQDFDGNGLISIEEIFELQAPVNSDKVVRQPVNILADPFKSELATCAVTADKRGNAPWTWATHSALTTILSFKNDDYGNFWIATGGHGIVRYGEGGWHQWVLKEELTGESVLAVGAGSEVVIVGFDYPWITAETLEDEKIYEAYIYLFDQETEDWEEIFHYDPGDSQTNEDFFGGLTVTEDGRIFIPMSHIETTVEGNRVNRIHDNKLAIYEDGAWTYVEIPIPINGVNDGEMDSQGNYWMATNNFGLLKYDGESFTSYSAGEGYFPLGSVKGLAITEDDTVWGVTAIGLGVVFPDGTGKVLLRDDYPLGQNPLEDIALDHDQRVWILSNERVTVYNGRQWAVVREGRANAVPNWSYNIGIDKDGCVWAAESGNVSVPVFRGILRLEPGDYSELYSLSPG